MKLSCLPDSFIIQTVQNLLWQPRGENKNKQKFNNLKSRLQFMVVVSLKSIRIFPHNFLIFNSRASIHMITNHVLIPKEIFRKKNKVTANMMMVISNVILSFLAILAWKCIYHNTGLYRIVHVFLVSHLYSFHPMILITLLASIKIFVKEFLAIMFLWIITMIKWRIPILFNPLNGRYNNVSLLLIKIFIHF